MEIKHQITIPKPCHENWDKMIPNGNDRFCGNCSKNVVDFTDMLPDEIRVYFQKDPDICGRFNSSQLKSLTIQIPSRVLYSQTQYHKLFLLALFIAMGTTLFSCSDKNGNKQKIDTVEIIEDLATDTNEIMVGKIKANLHDSLHHPTAPLSPTTNQIKIVKPHHQTKNENCTSTDSLPVIMGKIVPKAAIDSTKTGNK